MDSELAIDVNEDGLLALCAADKLVSVFQLGRSIPLATYMLPTLLGTAKRLTWAPPHATSVPSTTAYLLAVDCENGYAVLDVVIAVSVELRLRHACPLPSRAHSNWLRLERKLPALAVALQMPRLTVVWSECDCATTFTLSRGEPQASVFNGQHFIQWKRPQSMKDTVTLWPAMLTCELPIDAAALVTCSPYGPLFAYSDALIGGLYIGAIHNANVVAIADIQPIKLGWVKSGHIVCLSGSSSAQHSRRRLVKYDEALTELFSFSDATLGREMWVHRLVIDDAACASYELICGAECSALPFFDDATTFSVSDCGTYVAVKSSCAVSLWENTASVMPRLVRVFDYCSLPGFDLFWAQSESPCLLAYCPGAPYLCVYLEDRAPRVFEIDSRSRISRALVTHSGDLVICSARGYQYIAGDRLWPSDADNTDAYQNLTHDTEHSTPACTPLVNYSWLAESAERMAGAIQPTLKRGYAAMAGDNAAHNEESI